MKKLRITVEGKAYEVTVEMLGGEESSRASHPPFASPVQTSVKADPVPAQVARSVDVSTAPGSVPSPISGKVVSIEVASGKSVQAGDNLVTLEAMKMNTFVSAPQAGVIDRIEVSVGDSVEEGQSLVILV